MPPYSQLIKPPALKAGDTVGLICPGSRPSSPAVVQRCIRIVEEMGFKARLADHVLSMHGYMAGSDEERLEDLGAFLSDRTVQGIFCLTGGFGSLHLLQHLDYAAIASNPKVIVGSDDNTHLLLAVLSQSAMVTLHGPNLDQIKTRYAFERCKEAVTTKGQLRAVSADDTKSDEIAVACLYTSFPGTVSGALLGGNLTALVSLLGTPYQPDFAKTILFLEDRNERIDILDRWFTSLQISGQLKKVNAVAFGEFVDCGSKGLHDLLSPEELLGNRLAQEKVPSCFGLPAGQSGATVPLGVAASLDAGLGILNFESAHLS